MLEIIKLLVLLIILAPQCYSSQPLNPTWVKTIPLSDSRDLDLQGDYLYLAGETGIGQLEFHSLTKEELDELGGGIIAFSKYNVKTREKLWTKFIKDVKNIYPNPVQDQCNIQVSAKSNTHVKLSLLSMDGNKIRDLHNGYSTGSVFMKEFDSSYLSSGIYLIQLEMNGEKFHRKLIKLN